jgi:hypothetical protein
MIGMTNSSRDENSYQGAVPISTPEQALSPTPTTKGALTTLGKPTATATPTVGPTPTSVIQPSPTPTMQSAPAPSLLFGANMTLNDASDQVLTSASTRTLLQQMRLPIIRIPMRDNQPAELLIHAAKVVQSLGAIPVVILHGEERVPNALEADTRIIKAMNSIFGSGVVYYEYGNEQDLHGVSADRYTASWNKLIPQLKVLALNGRFIGPVNYQYNHLYLQYFLKNANPRPDAVSWHEYTCGSEWKNEECMQRLDNWTVHVKNARSIMSSTLGSYLPIMITEWNYTANPAPNDGKIDNPEFMTLWTKKALQTLAANGIFAAMHYSCTDYSIPLINKDATLTVQGRIFQQRG